MLAREGEGTVLEEELMEEKVQIKTHIKAKGLQYPNLNGKTFTQFQTDTSHHYVSFVSKLSPSPDWMVGVSMLDMCLSNCTWLAMKEVFLYPWDIGVSSGISHQTVALPSTPAQPIHRITSQYPRDMNNPFYQQGGGQGRPLARVGLRRSRHYGQRGTGRMKRDRQHGQANRLGSDS